MNAEIGIKLYITFSVKLFCIVLAGVFQRHF